MTLINEIDNVKNFYRSYSSVAEHRNISQIEKTHVATKVDQFTLQSILENKIVFLTGNPGDGKTHLLRKLEKEFKLNNVETILDANTKSYHELQKIINDKYDSNKALAVAINEGVLANLVVEAKKTKWAPEVEKQLFSPIVYDDEGDLEKNLQCIVIDLRLRNNLSKEIAGSILDKLIEISEPCKKCPGSCSIQINLKNISNSIIKERILELLGKLSKIGFHSTFRDLLAFYSFLIFGNTNCEKQQNKRNKYSYYSNAFNKGSGLIFDAINKLDPINYSNVNIDDNIWRDQYALQWESKIKTKRIRDINKNIDKKNIFEDIKRRTFFEIDEGDKILEQFGDMPNKMFNEIIKQPDDYITEIIRLINSSFGMKNEKNSLYLWMTHRFNSKRDRYAIAIDSFTKKDFKISLPKLNNLINECFVDFNPDHVVFHHKEQKIKEGLIIDIKFIESLLSVETGQTTAFRRSEPKIRFSNFFDKLNLISQRNTLTKIDLTIMNIEKKKSSSVKVDLINKKYLRIS